MRHSRRTSDFWPDWQPGAVDTDSNLRAHLWKADRNGRGIVSEQAATTRSTRLDLAASPFSEVLIELSAICIPLFFFSQLFGLGLFRSWATHALATKNVEMFLK